MRSHDSATHRPTIPISGLVWAALGVLAFSLTFPMTVFALRGFDPYVVGAGRSVLAAVAAAVCLAAVRAPLPRRHQWPGLVAVAVGCGIGFGLLSAIALGHTTATHAAVVVGLLPMATAVAAVARSDERPSVLFWLASGAGTAIVLGYAMAHGAGALAAPDLLLLAALVIGAVGYAEGGRLARQMPGWQVISWGVLLAIPVSLPFTVVAAIDTPPHPAAVAAAGLAYLSLVSMFAGFFAWYRGLATAGIARASQVQLLQPLLTIGWSALLLGERPGLGAMFTAIAVLGCVLVGQRARHSPAPGPESRSPTVAPETDVAPVRVRV